MSQVLAVNSFRRGTGATHVAANLAVALAQAGQRVGLLDADFAAPSQHFLFNVASTEMHGSLNDFLSGRSTLEDAAIEVNLAAAELAGMAYNGVYERGTSEASRVYYLPLTTDPHSVMRAQLSEDNLHRLNDGIQAAVHQLELDVLIVDTSAGIGREALLTLALCDRLYVVLTLDQQQVHGSGIIIDLARNLHVSQTQIVINKAPVDYDRRSVRRQISDGYGCEVAAILPYADEIAALESRSLFVLRYPEHPATWAVRHLADSVLATA